MEINNPLHAAILSLLYDARPMKEEGLSVVHNTKIKALADALRDAPAPATEQPVMVSLEKCARVALDKSHCVASDFEDGSGVLLNANEVAKAVLDEAGVKYHVV